MIRTITFDDSTHKLVPLEPTEEMRKACSRDRYWCEIDKEWDAMIEAAPEYQEPDLRAKLAVNMIQYLGAIKRQARAIIDGVFDGEHTIDKSDLIAQDIGKDK